QIMGGYQEAFQNIPCAMNPEPPGERNSYWMPTLVFDRSLKVNRDGLLAHLKRENIHARPFFYPLSSLPMFRSRMENRVAYSLFSRGLNLPSYHALDKTSLESVFRSVQRYLGKRYD